MLLQIELRELQIAGLGNLEVDGRAVDDGDAMAGALDYGSLVSADESVGVGLSKGALEEAEAEALRRLGVNDALAGDGGGDDGAVGGALDLLDGVHGGHGDDGGAVLDDGVDGAVDGGGVNEGADGVVDEDDVVGISGDGREGVGDGFLAIVAAFDKLDAGCEAVFGDLVVDAFHLRFSYGHADAGDAGDGGEGAQGVNKDRDAAQSEELFGLGTGHSGSEAGRRKDGEDLHTAEV